MADRCRSALAPLEADEFAGLMASLGPFERAPELGVAVSGGADSIALCLLADAWARARAGRIRALVVDHGLRPESGDEARQVVAWLAARDIAASVLSWSGAKPTADIQAAARAARYRLIGAWCRDAGVLHLLLGHHRDDQAETVLLRLGRGSGLDGLAAMAPIVETPAVRLLRPLLTVTPGRLQATATACGQAWIDDPSNRDLGFTRVRLRALAPVLAAEGVTAGRLSGAATTLGRARSAMEVAVARLLARAATVHPAGFCVLDPAPYGAAPDEVARRALTRALLCVGGGVYPPRGARLDRLHRALAGDGLGAGRTLAGCRIVPRRGGVLICREISAAGGEVALTDAAAACWDGRFAVRATPPDAGVARPLTVRRLGRDGWVEVTQARKCLRKTPIPGAVRPGLPAFHDLDGIVAVPHLEYVRTVRGKAGEGSFSAEFRPSQPLVPPAFAFVGAGR